MRYTREFVTSTVVGGVFVLLPVYLAVLLLLKGMQAVVGLVRPFAALLPDSLPAERLLSLVLVLIVCFAVGGAARSRTGRVARERIEILFFERLPGYGLFRSMTQRLAGDSAESGWKPALAEIEEALVPAFIIEEIADGRFAVFVPSVPTPFTGASTSSAGNACMPSTSHSPRRSSPSLDGDQDRRTWWPRCERRPGPGRDA